MLAIQQPCFGVQFFGAAILVPVVKCGMFILSELGSSASVGNLSFAFWFRVSHTMELN